MATSSTSKNYQIYQINLSVFDAEQQAKSLRSRASEIGQLRQNLQNVRFAIHANWTGDNAKIVCAAVDREAEALQDAIDKLNEIADAITKTAEEYRKAETDQVNASV